MLSEAEKKETLASEKLGRVSQPEAEVTLL
jgi:hypothetical protein